MGSPHYTPSGQPRSGKTAFSQTMREELALVESGIEALNEIPLVWHTENAAKEANYFEYFPINFSCTIKRIYVVSSGANGATNQQSTWFYNDNGGGLMGVKSLGTSAPIETVLIFEESDLSNTVFTGPDRIRIQMQGDEVSTIPLYVTFVVGLS